MPEVSEDTLEAGSLVKMEGASASGDPYPFFLGV